MPLVLTRNINEAIIIGDDIKITVLDVSGRSVRLGIDAPRDVIVDREEIREKRNSDNWVDDHGNR